MQFSTLSTVVNELSLLLSNARITRVFEGAGKNLFILFKKGKNDLILLVSPDRALPRLHLVSEKPRSLPDLHPFTLFLKSRMTGATLLSIGLLNQDRIVEIRFRRRGMEFRFIFEILGRGANLIVTDASSAILAVYYPVPVSENAGRPLFPGLQYELPVKKSFYPEKGIILEGVGQGTGDRAGAGTTAVLNRETELSYARLIDQKRIESGRSKMQVLTRRLQARVERRLRALLLDQTSAQDAESYKRTGNAILANLKSILPGHNRASLLGFDGESVEVTLDPGRSAAANAERYFKKYKKAKAGVKIIIGRLEETKQEAAFLESLHSGLERAESEDALLRLENSLIEKGYITVPRKKGENIYSPLASYRKILHQGWEIIVGKSAAGNDLITTRMARASDMWFHAEGMPGSHVLIRNPDAREIPSEVIEKAAGLAAFYSKGRNGTKVAVTYTFARFVKKPKGAKPGLVTLSERKTIMAVPAAE